MSHDIIGRHILTTASTPATSIQRSAKVEPVTIVASSTPVAAPTSATNCTPCEGCGLAIARIEAGLAYLIQEVSALKTRLDQPHG